MNCRPPCARFGAPGIEVIIGGALNSPNQLPPMYRDKGSRVPILLTDGRSASARVTGPGRRVC
jgi:hypothetical protein